jgi:hypothetical protein
VTAGSDEAGRPGAVAWVWRCREAIFPLGICAMFWKRPPVRLMRMLSVAMLVITAIIVVVPETPLPFPSAVVTQLVALGDALGLGP